MVSCKPTYKPRAMIRTKYPTTTAMSAASNRVPVNESGSGVDILDPATTITNDDE